MEPSDQAKRVFGAQVCRALIASAIDVKKKGAAEVEAKVKLCLQRDEKSARSALCCLISTLESEFLGISNPLSSDSDQFSEEIILAANQMTGRNREFVVGGLIAYLGVVRGYPPIASRALAIMHALMTASSDTPLLYYTGECVYNLALAAGNSLSIEKLFSILTHLWKEAAEPPLVKATSILDKCIRDIVFKNDIDVRELVLRNHNLSSWLQSPAIVQHLMPWVELVIKCNEDNGLADIRELLAILLRLATHLKDLSLLGSMTRRVGQLLARDCSASLETEISSLKSLLMIPGETIHRLVNYLIEQLTQGVLALGEASPARLVLSLCFLSEAGDGNENINNYIDRITHEEIVQIVKELLTPPAPTFGRSQWKHFIRILSDGGEWPEDCLAALTNFVLHNHNDKEIMAGAVSILNAQSPRLLWKQMRLSHPSASDAERISKLAACLSSDENRLQTITSISQQLSTREEKFILELYLALTVLTPMSFSEVLEDGWNANLLWPTQVIVLAWMRRLYPTTQLPAIRWEAPPKQIASEVETLIYILETPGATAVRHMVQTSGFYADLFGLIGEQSQYYRVARDRAFIWMRHEHTSLLQVLPSEASTLTAHADYLLSLAQRCFSASPTWRPTESKFGQPQERQGTFDHSSMIGTAATSPDVKTEDLRPRQRIKDALLFKGDEGKMTDTLDSELTTDMDIDIAGVSPNPTPLVCEAVNCVVDDDLASKSSIN